MDLTARIDSGTATVGVIGLGYVGLTEAVELARAGLHVTGFELDTARVRSVQAGRSYLVDISDREVAEVVEAGRLLATTDSSRLGGMDAILICVPTPLSKTKAPDLSYILSAVEAIRGHLRRGQLVVLESTTYPGTTSEVVLATLESTGLRAGTDFHLCFSPERINPGDPSHPPRSIPRIVGGITPACARVAAHLYRRVSPEVVVVSSTEAAEMVKLLENTFRAVNIGLVNELLLMCDRLGVDVWEIIDAAATKPFGFMKFTPGPGLGGHCIPIDPLYLSWKLKTLNYNARFIEMADEINAAMPRYWVQRVQDKLNEAARPVRGSRILVLGVAYKKDVGDLRESPALDILAQLAEKGAAVSYHDPYVSAFQYEGMEMVAVADLNRALDEADCVVVATDHSAYDWEAIRARARLLVDTRRAIPALQPAAV